MTVNTWPGWEYVRKLGSGSYGSVYEIRREEFGVEYKAALKVISIPKDESEVLSAYGEGMDEQSVTAYFQDLVKDITREFALMSQLKGQTNIVTYEDHMVIRHEDGIGWDILIRMELLTPLLDYCSGHTLTELDVIRLGCDICRALEICGRRGIIHRDIKPENIFVSEYGDFEIGDFGVARTLEKTTGASTKIGTNNYMAPEVFNGEHYDSRADIYSLGIVLYRYLNDGRTPFLPPAPAPIRYEDRGRALVRRLGGEEIPASAHGSPELKSVVLWAVAYDPEDRFASAAELREALEQCAGFVQTAEEATEEIAVEVEKMEAPDATMPLSALMGARQGDKTVPLSSWAASPESGGEKPRTEADGRTEPESEPAPAPQPELEPPARVMEALVRPAVSLEGRAQTKKKRMIWFAAAIAVVALMVVFWIPRLVQQSYVPEVETVEDAMELLEIDTQFWNGYWSLVEMGKGLSEEERYERALALMTPPEVDVAYSNSSESSFGNILLNYYNAQDEVVRAVHIFPDTGKSWEYFCYPNQENWVVRYMFAYDGTDKNMNLNRLCSERVELRDPNGTQYEKYSYDFDASGEVSAVTYYGAGGTVLNKW